PIAVNRRSASSPHHSQRLPRGAKSTETGRRNSLNCIRYPPTCMYATMLHETEDSREGDLRIWWAAKRQPRRYSIYETNAPSPMSHIARATKGMISTYH